MASSIRKHLIRTRKQRVSHVSLGQVVNIYREGHVLVQLHTITIKVFQYSVYTVSLHQYSVDIWVIWASIRGSCAKALSEIWCHSS